MIYKELKYLFLGMRFYFRSLFCMCMFIILRLSAQAQITTRLQTAVLNLEADPQLRHGIIGFEVMDSKTGKILFERNAQLGLAAASCQKVITSGAAFELLGKDYRFRTQLGYGGKIRDSLLDGDLFVIGSGDPTLGSWRYASTRDSVVLKRWVAAVQKQGIRRISGRLIADDSKFTHQLIPGGWIWDDVGNYYGAGAGALNWRENQYDLLLKSGPKPGDPVAVAGVEPEDVAGPFYNELVTGAEGSGDQAYIYLPSLEDAPLLNGSIPPRQNRFTISGSIINPTERVKTELSHALLYENIVASSTTGMKGDRVSPSASIPKAAVFFDTYLSPPLDSITYWFLKKSINLYGEALIKAIAAEKTGKGSTQKGVELVKDFWSRQGIDLAAINLMDGSGLSPQNRITADAFVRVLQFARSRPWFPSFYTALPEINSLHMKSGSIGGARGFTGYSKSSDGSEYTFALIVNNYDGSAGEIVRKMYKILDVLK